MNQSCDFLVIGSGLAGLSYALKVAQHGHVIVLSKSKVMGSNTSMAQGGIAAVMSPADSFESHVQDTFTAGAGLCHEDAVREVVQTAPARIDDLFHWGVGFDLQHDVMIGDKSGTQGADSQKLDLTREGGHSHRRILHVQDHTGHEIHQQLFAKVLAHPNIEIREEHFAIDLILDRDFRPFQVTPPRCIGAHVFDSKNQKPFHLFARFVMLATGGAGKTYLYTSNWSGATGDGIAMAHRAGARVANLEFMQFHPTCLYHPNARNFLISEAMRGEGGELINSDGAPFMKQYHHLGSLAPRDIVARAIDAEMRRTGETSVFLDCTSKTPDFLMEHFPVIYKTCLQYGIDITKQPIPVVPAAHYLCGGVITDLNGQSDIRGLLVTGETACTGLHGANRLASNSLLECLVFSHNAAKFSIDHLDQFPMPEVHQHTETGASKTQSEDEMALISYIWEEIRRLMWTYVGIVRTDRRLERAQTRLTNIMSEVSEYYRGTLHPDIIELRNIAQVADLTVKCALMRKESRGIHYNTDYPMLDTSRPARDSVV